MGRPKVLFILLPLLAAPSTARPGTGPDSLAVAQRAHNAHIDSINASYRYTSGTVAIAGPVATLNLPPEFKFLDPEQSRQLMVDVWENPPAATEGISGLIFPQNSGVYDDNFVFSVEYDTIGYVSDSDAEGLDYGAMLLRMMKEDSAENVQRIAGGYDPLYLMGWAAEPHYDKERRALHWAQELMRGEDSSRVLNYNIRLLGRKGVIILNAMGSMDHLDSVQVTIPTVLDMLAFNDGYRYDQYDPETDAVAQWTVGGLIDGRMKEKLDEAVGLLKLIGIIFLIGVLLLVAIIFIIYRRRSHPDAVR